jgi:hypothetical protein
MTDSDDGLPNANNNSFGSIRNDLGRGHYRDYYILEFQSVNFLKDAKVATDLLLSCLSKAKASYKNAGATDDEGSEDDRDNDKLDENAAFSFTQPFNLAGWSFAELRLTSEFVKILYEFNSYEIDSITHFQKVNGKYYESDILTMRFVCWIAEKLQDAGCQANVKIGEKMADYTYGGTAPAACSI